MNTKRRSRKKSRPLKLNLKEPLSKYRSKLEQKVAADLGKKYEYESKDGIISYTLVFDYLPDFYRNVGVKEYLIEVKGFFRPGDSKKYVGVINACKADPLKKEIIFLFANPYRPVHKGGKLTYADWADKHDVMWFATSNVHDLKQYIENGVLL